MTNKKPPHFQPADLSSGEMQLIIKGRVARASITKTLGNSTFEI
jgi:hypothetical protein